MSRNRRLQRIGFRQNWSTPMTIMVIVIVILVLVSVWLEL
jgi:hypothetical protein